MEEFLADLKSPRFWFSVVLVGLVINVVGLYVNRLLDARIAAISKRRSLRQRQNQEKHKILIDLVRSDAHKQIMLAAAESRNRLLSLVFLVQAVGLVVITIMSVIFWGINWVTVFLVVWHAIFWSLYLRYSRAADRASDILTQLHQNLSP